MRLGFAELLAAAFVGRDPATYAEAMRSAAADEWTKACQYEMDALTKNGTWELVDLLCYVSLLDCSGLRAYRL